MFVVRHGQQVRFEVYAPARQQQCDIDLSCMGVAGTIPEAVTGIRSGRVWIGEESVMEDLAADFGGEEGEERGSDLRVNVRAAGNFGDGGGFAGGADGTFAFDVGERRLRGGAGGHDDWVVGG